MTSPSPAPPLPAPPLPAPPLPTPLVAPREDTTRATSGVALVETGDALHDAIASGSWRDGALAGLGFGIELAAAVLDPLGALAAAGVGWLMEHVRPLSDLLDRLTGDPDAVAAQARTWRNVATAVRAAGEEMGRAAAPGDDWAGDAADAFTRAGTARAEEIRASAVVADALGAAVEGAGSLVSLVREVVRELIAQLVATLVVRVPQWALEEVGSLGLATPHVVASAVAVIAKVTTRVVRLAEGLVRSLRRLGDLVGELLDLARRLVTRAPASTPAAPTVPARVTPASAPSSTAADSSPAPARATDLPAHPFGPGAGTRPADTPAEAPRPVPTGPARAPGPPPEPPLPPEQRAALAQRIRAALEPEPPTRPAATPPPLGEGVPPVAPGAKTLVDRIPETRVTRGANGLIEAIDGRPYRDVVRELTRQRAEEFRAAQATKALSAKSVGNATSVAIDRRTSAVVEATNGRKGAVLPDPHPELRRRYDDLLANGPYPAFERDGARLLDPEGRPTSREHPHPDHPLRHSEVKAIDSLLRLRGAGADRDALRELAVDTFFPFGDGGVRPARSCANCTSMMGEAVSLSGKLSHFPGPPS